MHPFSLATREAPRLLRLIVLLMLAFVMAGCGPGDLASSMEPSDAGSDGCSPGELPRDGGGCQPPGLPPDMRCKPGELELDDGGCQPAGLPPDMPCPPGELPLDGGGCQPAGVPPEACGKGFEPDGQQGCNPILPADPCSKGQMAVPGDTQCHEVAPCGTGDYGDIPVEATTQFVNGSYAGTDSNGTQAKPWKHIQEGIDHAVVGAIVAVAAGSYTEDLFIKPKPVRLWGRCPALVEVVGTGKAIATVQAVYETSSHTELHTIAVTGPGGGVLAVGSREVIIDHVWIHDTTDRGLKADDGLGLTSITVSGSLVEATTLLGIYVGGADATIGGTVVRATQPKGGIGGHGIQVEYDADSNVRSKLTLRGSLLEQNHYAGVDVSASDATIEGIVVRGTQAGDDGTGGFGVEIQDEPTRHERAKVTLRTSLFEQNYDNGVLVQGSDATIESTVVRATLPYGNGAGGVGLLVEAGLSHAQASVTLRTSLIDHNHDMGIAVLDSNVTIEATVVRATQPSGGGALGHGIQISEDGTTHGRSNVTLRASVLEQNQRAGVIVFGSDATIETTVVRDGGVNGRGVEIVDHPVSYDRAKATLRRSLVDHAGNVGVLVTSSDVTIEESVVRATQSGSDGIMGDGVVIQDGDPPHERAAGVLRGVLLEQNHDIGVHVIGSDATIEGSIVRGTQPRSNGIGGRGVESIDNLTSRERAKLTLRNSLVEQNHEIGVGVFDSDATIEATVVRATQSRIDMSRGDGVMVDSHDTQATALITSSEIKSNARAGISNFSAAIILVSSIVQCNVIDLNGEREDTGQPFTFDGSKGNICGCDDTPDLTCQVLSSTLSPPPPSPPM